MSEIEILRNSANKNTQNIKKTMHEDNEEMTDRLKKTPTIHCFMLSLTPGCVLLDFSAVNHCPLFLRIVQYTAPGGIPNFSVGVNYPLLVP